MHKVLPAFAPWLCAVLAAQGVPEVEPNDSAPSATVIASGMQGDGAIAVVGDADYWRITLTAPGDLRCWINPGAVASLADSDLTLFAADGTTQLAFNDDASGSTNWLSRLVVGNLPAGDLYLRVRSSASFTPGGTGSYTIDIVAAPPGTYVPLGGGPLTPVVERAEPNDPRQLGGLATNSLVNSRNTGFLASGAGGSGYAVVGADYDFFQLQIPTPGTLTMSTGGGAAPMAADTVLHLVDASLARIAFDDDSGPGLYSLLVFQITAPGTYYVAVSDYVSGNYVLDVTLTPPLPVAPATVVERPGGCGPRLGTRPVLLPAGSTAHTELPVLGSQFWVDLTTVPANAPLLRVIGLTPLATPFDLSGQGAPGCVVEVAPLATTFVLADAAGRHFWRMDLPLALGLIGLPLEQQVAAIDPVANALGLVVSNRTSSVCGMTN